MDLRFLVLSPQLISLSRQDLLAGKLHLIGLCIQASPAGFSTCANTQEACCGRGGGCCREVRERAKDARTPGSFSRLLAPPKPPFVPRSPSRSRSSPWNHHPSPFPYPPSVSSPGPSLSRTTAQHRLPVPQERAGSKTTTPPNQLRSASLFFWLINELALLSRNIPGLSWQLPSSSLFPTHFVKVLWMERIKAWNRERDVPPWERGRRKVLSGKPIGGNVSP